MTDLGAEDAKLVTLAKAARSRVQASQGAAVRDTTGRTYASANVDRPGLHLSAIELAVGQAYASGATGLEAVVLCAEDDFTQADREILSSPNASVAGFFIDLSGDVRGQTSF